MSTLDLLDKAPFPASAHNRKNSYSQNSDFLKIRIIPTFQNGNNSYFTRQGKMQIGIILVSGLGLPCLLLDKAKSEKFLKSEFALSTIRQGGFWEK